VTNSLTVLTLQSIPSLTATQTIVQQGDTVRLSWDTNNGDEKLCTLTGGNINGAALLGNSTGDNETGYADVVISGRTTYTLTCGGQSNVKTIEIIPTGWEG
jgi:hypothetical protein